LLADTKLCVDLGQIFGLADPECSCLSLCPSPSLARLWLVAKLHGFASSAPAGIMFFDGKAATFRLTENGSNPANGSSSAPSAVVDSISMTAAAMLLVAGRRCIMMSHRQSVWMSTKYRQPLHHARPCLPQAQLPGRPMQWFRAGVQ